MHTLVHVYHICHACTHFYVHLHVISNMNIKCVILVFLIISYM